MNDKLCAAPFVSFYTGLNHQVKSCCAMMDPIGYSDKDTFENIMNSETAKSIRRKLMNNEFPPECASCADYERDTGEIAGVRKFSNRLVKDTSFLDKTLPDGTLYTQTPVFLDLLFSNKCNFACMGCDPTLSSTIADKYTDAYDILFDREYPRQNWQNKSDIIDYILKYKDSIRLLHFNGGEPFMQTEVHEILDVLLKNNLQNQIRIWSHTNGSIKKYKGVDVVEDYLKHWGSNCEISLSHDMHNERGEYVRYGLVTKKWEENFQRITDANILINIHTSYNIFNCLHLCDLFEYYKNHLNHKGLFTLSYWQNPMPFSAPFAQVDEKILQEANNQLNEMQMQLGGKYGTQNIAWNTRELRNFLNIQWSDEQLVDLKNRFKKSIAKFDQLRGTNFVETFPELRSLYEN